MPNNIVDRILGSCDGWRCVRAEQRLFRQVGRLGSLFVVSDGLTELLRRDHLGAFIVLQRAGAGEMLAEE